MRSERLHLRHIRNTSTFRLTVLLGLVAMIGMMAMLALIYGLSERELNARSDLILRAEASRLLTVPAVLLPSEIRGAIARSSDDLDYYGLLAPDGTKLAGNISGASGFKLGRPRETPARPGSHGAIRMLAVRGPANETILIGRDIAPVVYLRRRVTEILVLSGIAIGMLILFAGIALSLAPLRRLDGLQRSAMEIAAGDLDARMPIFGRGDELDLFAGTVNTMVEEVGRVVSQVKAVTDAVAHDLRTPLTRVRAQLYRASREAGGDSAVAGRIDLAIADLDMVLSRFAGLLRISELEARSRRAGFGPVALRPLIDAVVGLYDPLAEARGVTLSSDALHDVVVDGDDKLLFEAIGNLVDNAIKFAPEGGHVRLALARDGSHDIFEIRDDGPGIPAELHKSVLRRFDRGNAPQTIDGTGLGLSLVSAILHLHQFELEFADAAPGLIVRIIAPHR